ncbi:flagellar hook-length control protein FliK [Cohnella xylanilytica]|uniref:Flagellar hook-length control protein FliK n=1 Tax=Cohnella xylanilytica TaxID=557555 RepID=A0A841U1X3_9BACL|nr:flagellar hook-length control protein FliK [Cohnella xylanilytica]MBB6694747.1 flagellar hook-length control protein FliK [Cohnella xylanilytica]
MSRIMMPNASMGPAAAPATASGSGAGKTAGGNAFAGALVQAIGGEGSQAAPSATTGLTVSAMLAAALGSLTGEGDAEANAGLLELLSGLIDRMQPLAEDETLPEDARDPLAELLASLQALLEQLSPALPEATTSPDMQLTAGDELAALPETGQGSGADRLALLLPALLHASKQAFALTSQPEEAEKAFANAIQRLQQALAPAIAAQSEAQTAQAQAAADPSKASVALPLSGSGPQTAEETVVAAEPRKAVSAFKEPIVLWNLANAADASAETADMPVVQAAAEDRPADGNGQPLPWMLMGQEAAKQANAQSGQPTLPAQVPVHQFSQQVGNYLVKQFVLTEGNGISEAKLSLRPEHLGQVDIRIAMQDGQLTAQFVAHNGTAKELLENQMAQLRAALQVQGIQVERMEVVEPTGLNGSALFQGHEQREPGSGGGDGQASKRDREGSYEDPVTFEAEMERTSVLREAGYGGAINVTA